MLKSNQKPTNNIKTIKCTVCDTDIYTNIDKITMLENIGLTKDKAKRMIQICNHSFCDNCLIKTQKRGANCEFYTEYIGVCSDCIWWDIG